MVLDSWFPLRIVILSLYLTLRASKRQRVQTEQYPLSTQSPRNRQLVSGTLPPILKSSMRSQNCPWTSPQMITGALTGTTLDSAAMISLALSQRTFTSASGSSSHFESLSMYSSKFPISSAESLGIFKQLLILAPRAFNNPIILSKRQIRMQWISLQLDMLPAIAIETAKVIQLYRNVSNDIEMGQSHLIPKLKQLNVQLRKRVNQLDLFYSKFYFDERVHLFHRLKLQIKKAVSRSIEEIEKSYIHAQSLDLSKVREELALIESTLEKEYEKEEKITPSKPSGSKKSLTQSRNKVNLKKSGQQVTPKSKAIPNKLNLEKLKTSESKMTTSRVNKPLLTSSSKSKPTQRASIPSIESTSRQPSHPQPHPSQPPKAAKPPMQCLMFTIKMTKQQYLQFLQSKKNS